jgi:hypothetical protein
MVTLTDDPSDLHADLLERDVERAERTCGQPLLLAQQSQQEVLGSDVVVFEHARLILGKDDGLAGTLGEALEHGAHSRTAPKARACARPACARLPCRG